MESIEITASEMAEIGKDTLKLFGSRGTIEIISMFCCSVKRVRFKELNSLLSHISTKTLASRLKMLEEYGILKREAYNEIPPRVEYSMTEKGQKLAESIGPLLKWMIDSAGIGRRQTSEKTLEDVGGKDHTSSECSGRCV